MATDNFDINLGFEAEAAEQPAVPAITTLPPPPTKVLDRKKSSFDMGGAALGLLRRSAVSISATCWELMMKRAKRSDQVDNPFLQAPPPTDLHYQYAIEILETLGGHHRWSLWGLLLALSGKELIPAGDKEIDLGMITQPLVVDKSLIVNLADFMVITVNTGMHWWSYNAAERGVPPDLLTWADAFYRDLERVLPGAIEKTVEAARASETLQVVQKMIEESDPDAPENWGYTRLGAVLNSLSAPPLEEIISSALKKRMRVQFDGVEMIRWLDQVHRGMSTVIARMTAERRQTFQMLNLQAREEIMRRSATAQEAMLQKWTQQFKIAN